MSRNDSKAPTAEAPPSRALQALGDNLNTDARLTLSKKKSWFGSWRDAVQKGALQAKLAVDSIRGDQSGVSSTNSDTDPRQSVDSATSDTALLKSENDLVDGPVPKRGMASLRSHKQQNARKHHHKRSSVTSSRGRPSSDSTVLLAPDHFHSPPKDDKTTFGHKRHGSVANGLVGSIRGLSRKKQKMPEAPPAQKQASSERSEKNVPLPSSPINIPTAAPSLQLDLGPAAFMSSTFASVAKNGLGQDELKLTDPVNIASGRPESPHFCFPDQINTSADSTPRRVTPRDILSIPGYSERQIVAVDDPALGTPMPGSNFTLEMDGADSDQSDRSQVFERTVTPQNDKERKELRTMRSLDAIAGACAVAQAKDETMTLPERVETRRHSEPTHVGDGLREEAKTQRQRRWSDPRFFQPPGFLEPSIVSEAPLSLFLDPYTGQRESFSGLFVETIAPGKVVHIPQRTKEPVNQLEGLQESKMEDWFGNDPFTVADSCHSLHSRSWSVLLPFRPKTCIQSDQSTATFIPKDSLGDQDITTSDNTNGKSLQTLLPADHATNSETQPYDAHVTMMDSENDQYRHKALLSTDETEHAENLASDNETRTAVQELLHSDIVLLEYDDAGSTSPGGFSPHGGPLTSDFIQRVQESQTPSPGSSRSRTTCSAGLWDAEYKFSFDHWLLAASTANSPDLRTRTRNCRTQDVSIDSVSTGDEFQTPQISPTLSNMSLSPLGSKLDFDLKVSERNTRYNALQCQTEADDADTEVATKRQPIRFVLGRSEGIDADAFALADFENAYASSTAGSPRKTSWNVKDMIEEAPRHVSTSVSFEGNADENLDKSGSGNHANGCLPDKTERSSILMVETVTPEVGSASREQLETQTSEKDTQQEPASLCDFRNNDDSISTPVQTLLDEQSNVPESSADLPLTQTSGPDRHRVRSSDTLDDSLTLFSSPESGYQADKSSVSPSARSRVPRPTRYRTLAKPASSRKPHEDRSNNDV